MTPIARLLTTVLAGLALFLSLGAWSLSSPVGAAPDDDFHLASIWCGDGVREGLCEPGSDAKHWQVPNKIIQSTCYAFHPEVNASCQGPGYLDEGFRLAETDRLNAGSHQYPQGFYWWMSHLAGDNVAASTIAIRLVNAALFSVLMVGTWRLLPRRFRFTLSAGAALTAVPLAMFLIPSANPSSWSIISMAIMFPAMLGYLAARGWRAVALGGITVLSALLGLGARGDSAAYVVVAVCAALVLSFRRERDFFLRALLPVALVVLAVVAFLGAGQTGLAIGGMGHTPATSSRAALILANLLAMPNLWAGIYGLGWGLGWLDTLLQPVVWAGALLSVCGVLFVAFRWQGWRKLVAVLGVAAAALIVPLYILVSSNVVVGYEVQPRYILPLLTLLIATVLAPSEAPGGRERTGILLSGPQVWLIAGLLSVANAVALYGNMHRYTGQGTMRLSGQVAWWWHSAPTPLITWVIGAGAFAVTMAVFARSAALRARSDAPAGPSGSAGGRIPVVPSADDAPGASRDATGTASATASPEPSPRTA
ncbi:MULTISPECIES: DUF2142 domain-containing protein [unclassified Microbacterium]|uniref:DUF2142 domain-containing protein n=1 Tax=unclassified Microbacterium TaxID=2609290 RepID=UPI00301629F6